MAHFAKLDSNNIVISVNVVNNNEITDADGIEREEMGQAFLMKTYGGNWKQTSYNGTIRKNYAGIGYIYDEDRDAFYEPQPYQAWTLNEETCIWEPPTLPPQDDNIYMWDSDANNWTAVE